MITLKEFMEVTDYRITEGSDFGWHCWGPKSYSLTSWNGEHNGYSFTVTFDTDTQEVYMVEAHDFARERAYRIINEQYRDAYNIYAQAQGHDSYMNQAWDGVDYTDLEVVEDWIQKAQAIKAGVDYDTRVSVPLDIPEADLLLFFKAAHERDMTFNQFVEEAVRSAMAEYERDPEGTKARYQKYATSTGSNGIITSENC